jgi:hypothetical protein
MVTASTATNLVGQGSTRGVQIRVPNLGSQWRMNHSATWLDVQVADATPEAVVDSSADVIDEVAAALASRQDELGIDPDLRVTSIASSPNPPIAAMGGSRLRAAVASGASGALATIALIYWLERRRNRRLSAVDQG